MGDLERVAREQVGILGTIGPDGRPHLVPVTFALTDGQIVTAIDWKPKHRPTLQRLDNIEADPRVSFLVHHYAHDWDELWWVRVDGRADIHRSGPLWERAISSLVAKYDQYRERPPEGAAIVVSPDRIRSWSA